MRYSELITEAADITSLVFYHGTDLPSLVLMLKDNRVDPQTFGGPAGASLTSDLDMAKGFADRATARWVSLRDVDDDIPPELGHPSYSGAVLQLSAEALKRAGLSIALYHDEDRFGDDDEFEVRVGGLAGISGLSRFLTGFTCRPADLDWYARFCDAAAPGVDLYGLTAKDYQALLHNPLRREP